MYCLSTALQQRQSGNFINDSNRLKITFAILLKRVADVLLRTDEEDLSLVKHHSTRFILWLAERACKIKQDCYRAVMIELYCPLRIARYPCATIHSKSRNKSFLFKFVRTRWRAIGFGQHAAILTSGSANNQYLLSLHHLLRVITFWTISPSRIAGLLEILFVFFSISGRKN